MKVIIATSSLLFGVLLGLILGIFWGTHSVYVREFKVSKSNLSVTADTNKFRADLRGD